MRYSQPNPYIKSEMGPPARAPEGEQHDPKDPNGGYHSQVQSQVSQHQEEEADHEHEAEYTHGNPTNYDASRGSYSYSNGPAVGSLPNEHSHLSPEMTGSPGHPPSGRATPRTTAPPQPYYPQQGGYTTPPRIQPPSSNLFNVMSSERASANGSAPNDVYGSQTDLGNPISNGYAGQQPVMNGAGNKRSRDDDDARPASRGLGGVDVDGLKRRKTIREGSVSGPPTYEPAPLNRARAAITQRRR